MWLCFNLCQFKEEKTFYYSNDMIWIISGIKNVFKKVKHPDDLHGNGRNWLNYN